MRLRQVLVLALGLLVAPLARADAQTAGVADNPKVAAALEVARVWLDAQRDFEQIPGLSAAVVHDQDVLWIGGFGYADVERKAPTGGDTIYSICSISKLFTSIAVMQQRDEGRLRLDDPVQKHLAWFNIQVSEPEGGEVTVGRLLTHASGLPRESNHPYWTGPDFPFPSHDELVAGLKSQKTLYPADTFFQYSNLGLTLAGDIAAAAAGCSYQELVQARILTPLGMSSTFPEMPASHRKGRLANGYSAIGRDGTRTAVPFFQARSIAPAAGFASTAADLARFASWQFRLLAHGGSEVLKANTLREMHRVHWVDPNFETTRGLGFSVWRSENRTFVGHGGSCPGFRSQLLLKPDERLATIVLANAQGVDTTRLAQRVYELVAPAVREAAKRNSDAATGGQRPTPKLPDQSFEAYVGNYTSGFSGEVAIVRWEDGLASLSLPTTDPVRAITKLRRTGENTFRRVRRDDEGLGEELVFDIGPDGKAWRIIWNNNYYGRVR
jgi:CubicO group peptidase (beta-lactamase class C family)